jgi:hypothetical protein
LLTFLPAKSFFITNFFGPSLFFRIHFAVLVGIVPWAHELHFWTIVYTVITVVADNSVVNFFTIFTLEITFLMANSSLDGAVLIWSTIFFVIFCSTHGWETSFLRAGHGADCWFVKLST